MFAFIDESGYPRPTDATLRPTLAAVCIMPSDLRDVTRDLYRIKQDLWGPNGPELHAKKFITRRAVRDKTKKETVERAIQVIGGYETLRLFAVVMERPDEPLPATPEKVGYHYFHILKRVHLYADLIYERAAEPSWSMLFGQHASTGAPARKRKKWEGAARTCSAAKY